MVQFRRLDPLANAGPWQRHMKRAVKTFTLTQDQYTRIEEKRPKLIVMEDERVVVGQPLRDFLVVHYAFPDVPEFSDNFRRMFDACTFASSREEAPRGAILSFRDRPNRARAVTTFWDCALDEAGHWVEMDHLSVPEQDEPGDSIEGGYQVRDATTADRDIVAKLEAEVVGLPQLSAGGVDSLFEDAEWIKLVTTSSGVPVGCLVLRREPGGWGIIDHVFLLNAVRDELREPATRWAIAFLRNNGGRRQRRRVYLDQTEDVALMRALEFSPGETGVDYVRPVEEADVRRIIEDRKSHGTMIKFGDWR
jgi:hypothetical protein